MPTGPTTPIARLGAIVGLLLSVLVLWIVVTRSGDTYEVVAVFDDVRGLLEGGHVTAGSLNVGKVEKIELGEDGLPRVRLSIEDDFRLRQGAIANIKLASNVGAVNRYVDLEQGDGPELPDGATLGPSFTDQPVDFDTAVSTLDPKTRDDVAAVIAGLDRATVGRGDELDAALRHSAEALGETADLLDQVNIDRNALRVLVKDGRRVVEALAANPDDLGATAEQAATVLRIAAGRQRELERATEDLGPGLREARLAVDRLGASTDDLREFVAAARPPLEQLVPLARDIPPFVAALHPGVVEARKLIRAAPPQLAELRSVVRAALPVIGRLDSILARLNPFLDHLRARAPEVVGFFTLLADVTSNYDVNGNVVRTTVPFIQQNRHPNLIGPSFDGAGSLVRPFDRTPGVLEGEPWRRYYRSFIGGGRLPRSFLDPGEEGP